MRRARGRSSTAGSRTSGPPNSRTWIALMRTTLDRRVPARGSVVPTGNGYRHGAPRDQGALVPEDRRIAVSRVVLVTGGNRGIGLAIARRSSPRATRSRSRPAPASCRRSSPAPTCSSCRPTSPTAPASTPPSTASRPSSGPVEVVVANAGITRDGLIMRMSDDDIDAVIDTNLVGALRVARRAAKGMLRLRRGRLVFVSSVVGLLGSAGQANYAASKAGLVGLARSLARELGSRGITANVVAPGFVDTDMTAELPEERRAEIIGAVPLGRYASPARGRRDRRLPRERRRRLHHRGRHPRRRRPRHGALTDSDHEGRPTHGNPRGQEPARHRCAHRPVDRLPRREARAGGGRDTSCCRPSVAPCR